jgi:DNA replicative helicase MCM subunit Mcm2 (Cdc46/Mcm family)
MVIDIEGEDSQNKKFDFLNDYNAKAAVEQEVKRRRELYDRLYEGPRSFLIQNFMRYHELEINSNTLTWQQFLDWHPVLRRQDEQNLRDICTLEYWQALIEFGVQEGEEFMSALKTVGLRKIKDYPLAKIKDLGTEYAEKLVAVVAPVIGMSAIRPDDSCVYYECKVCHAKPLATPDCTPCGRKGASNFITKIDSKKAIDKQIIVLQEGPLTLSCIISGPKEMMWRVKPGQKAYALGVLKFEPVYNRHTRKNEMHPYLDLLYTEPADNQEIEITKQDIEKFKEMVQDPLFKQHLLNSFAPHIRGNEEQKEVCIYVMASQGLLRPNNGLLLGPPARGKTKLLQYCSRLAAKGILQSFGRVSIPGLLSATVTDEHTGQKINKPGLFASYSFVALNEMQSIQDKKDLKISLNDVLDRKEVTSAKADGDYNIEARCAVLLDSNNYMGLWDYGARLADNLQFMEPNIGPFLSRMDLMSVVQQKRTDDEEDEITGTIFDSYEETDDAILQYMDDWETEDGQPRYGFSTLRKFFHYISQQPEARVDKSLRQHFVEQCKIARKHDQEMLLDGRYQETVMRQTRIGGRLLLKENADKDDMDEAFRLVNRSKNIVVETEVFGEKDGNVMLGLQPKTQIKAKMAPEETFEQACKEVMEKTGKEYFELYEIVKYMTEDLKYPGWTESRVKAIIQKWCWSLSKLQPYGAEGSDRFKFTQKKMISGEEDG